jgi:hypothetical protein
MVPLSRGHQWKKGAVVWQKREKIVRGEILGMARI